MIKPRYQYYFRAIICFTFSIVFLIAIPIFIPGFFNKVGISIGVGIGLGIISLVIGFINYFIAKEDGDSEKQKRKRIEQLEKELNDLKCKNQKDYKMRDFD